MQYMGGKFRISKTITDIMMLSREPGQWYVEPFCGGCNVIDKITGPRLAADNHYWLIAMWRAVLRGWEPPGVVTEEEYQSIKAAMGQYPPELVGFVGFGCSYGGKWWGGYARTDKTGARSRNYAGEARRSIERKRPLLDGVVFQCCPYWRMSVPSNSLIYCDPPYADTTGYKTGDFDHELFWQWVRNMTSLGHTVFVSEYTAPDDFYPMWEKPVKTMLAQGKTKHSVEKLFAMR